MKPGPKPRGETAMTAAERQARYRAARQVAPVVRDRRSLPQRWHDAVAELVQLQAECDAWLQALPCLHESAPADALQAMWSADLSELDLDLSGLDGVKPPRGFGRG